MRPVGSPTREARVVSTALLAARYSRRGSAVIASTRVRTLTGEGNEQDFRVDRRRDVHGGNWLGSRCRPRWRAGQEGRRQDGEEGGQEEVVQEEVREVREVRGQDGQEVTRFKLTKKGRAATLPFSFWRAV